MANTPLNNLIEALAGAVIEAQEGKRRKLPQTVSADIDGGGGEKSGNVHVVLRVESVKPTEGAARLMNHLLQTQSSMFSRN